MFSATSLSRSSYAPVQRPGLSGIQKAGDSLYRVTASLLDGSFAEDDAGERARDFTALKTHLLLLQASGRVVKTSTTSTGQLIDLLV